MRHQTVVFLESGKTDDFVGSNPHGFSPLVSRY